MILVVSTAMDHTYRYHSVGIIVDKLMAQSNDYWHIYRQMTALNFEVLNKWRAKYMLFGLRSSTFNPPMIKNIAMCILILDENIGTNGSSLEL